jgi:hypothetical protein
VEVEAMGFSGLYIVCQTINFKHNIDLRISAINAEIFMIADMSALSEGIDNKEIQAILSLQERKLNRELERLKAERSALDQIMQDAQKNVKQGIEMTFKNAYSA